MGKDVIIGEERRPKMIKPKSLKGGQWQKNEGGKPQQCPKATFDNLMAKYNEGMAGIRGHETRPSGIPTRTVRFPWVRLAHLQSGAHSAKDLELHCGNVQRAKIIINRIITWCLTSWLGHQCLGHGDLRR
jgi:hypothetical protein